MMELEMNGQRYGFKFGLGFLREMNKKVTMPDESVPKKNKEVGFKYYAALFLDDDVPALIEILETANKGQEPRVTNQVICDYIDDPDTDLDALFEEVKDFLLKANATRKDMKKLADTIEENKRIEEQMKEALIQGTQM